MIKILRIKGTSMFPTLKQDDYVLVLSFLKIKENDIVTAEHPETKQTIIKRVSKIENDEYFLNGDNDTSMNFILKKSSIKGKVLKVIPKKVIIRNFH